MVLSLNMGWQHVLFANWPVDPAVVDAHLPDDLAVDTHDEQAWLSAVPFTNVEVHPVGVPDALGYRLPELNLRTYVTHNNEPGVYFFSLDAQGIFSVLGARIFHHLPYYYARIDLDVHDGEVHFESHRRHPGARPVDFSATYKPIGPQLPDEPDSLERFLTARYRYYTESIRGTLRYANVDHEPWPLYETTATIEESTLFQANGFAEPSSDPIYFYSPRVDTVASPNQRVESPPGIE